MRHAAGSDSSANGTDTLRAIQVRTMSASGQTQKSRADLDRSGSRPIAAKRWPPALVGGLV